MPSAELPGLCIALACFISYLHAGLLGIDVGFTNRFSALSDSQSRRTLVGPLLLIVGNGVREPAGGNCRAPS